MKTTKSYIIENTAIKESTKILVETDEDIKEEVTDFLYERFINSNHFVIKQKADDDVTAIYQYYPDKKNINEDFITNFLKMFSKYPSSRFDVEEKYSVTLLKIIINIDSAYENEKSGAQNYNYAETYLNELLIPFEEDTTKINYGADYSSMKPMELGKAKSYLEKHHFDNYHLFDFIDKGKVEKIVINTLSNSSAEYNRISFNKMGPEQQAKYLARLEKQKTEFEIWDVNGGYYTVPRYVCEYVMLTYPDLLVETK